eukprot:COSAG01_NODE_17628_length_1136_cov_1.180328_1_plen_169_part_10
MKAVGSKMRVRRAKRASRAAAGSAAPSSSATSLHPPTPRGLAAAQAVAACGSVEEATRLLDTLEGCPRDQWLASLADAGDDRHRRSQRRRRRRQEGRPGSAGGGFQAVDRVLRLSCERKGWTAGRQLQPLTVGTPARPSIGVSRRLHRHMHARALSCVRPAAATGGVLP